MCDGDELDSIDGWTEQHLYDDTELPQQPRQLLFLPVASAHGAAVLQLLRSPTHLDRNTWGTIYLRQCLGRIYRHNYIGQCLNGIYRATVQHV